MGEPGFPFVPLSRNLCDTMLKWVTPEQIGKIKFLSKAIKYVSEKLL